MRTKAEAQRSAAGADEAAPASRRARAGAIAESAADQPVQAFPSDPPAVAVTDVRMLRVDEGLYVLRVGEIPGKPGEIAGMAVPVAQVSAPLADSGDPVEIVASFPGRGPWLDRAGGTVVMRSPPGGGLVIVTVYGGAEERSELSLELQRLDGAAAVRSMPQAPGVTAPAGAAAREIPTEILLHIERAGDRLFPGRGWVGALGRRMRIEALSIRPLESLAPTDIEMKGFLPSNGETPWVPGGTLCGTRGRGLPLLGFAVRLVGAQAERFDVVYQGSFFAGGISQMQKNGAPCRATTADDPLEAINVRLIERAAEPEATATVE